MTTSEMAKIMGRKGGLARAKRLTSTRRSEIAKLGAQARMESLRLAKRIKSNFEHLKFIKEMKHANT